MEQQTGFFIEYLPLEISLCAVEKAMLPAYLGSTLRGAIGQALYPNTAVYNYLYNNRALSGGAQDILNPYIILPPPGKKALYTAGETLCFQMILLGEAARYTEALVATLSAAKRLELGVSRHPFVLQKVTHSVDRRVIWQGDTFYKVAARSVALAHHSLPNVKEVTIRTETPLRIRRNGALLEKLDFPTVVRNITQRVGAIATRYGGRVDTAEVDRLQTLAADIVTVQHRFEVKELQRFSNRLNDKMDFSGLVGSITFEGALTPFAPWLYAAQTLHMGRNTTFGMGKIELEFI